MSLVKERNRWRDAYKFCEKPEGYALITYRKNRDSEKFRLSAGYEKICEYILFLEDRIKELEDEE